MSAGDGLDRRIVHRLRGGGSLDGYFFESEQHMREWFAQPWDPASHGYWVEIVAGALDAAVSLLPPGSLDRSADSGVQAMTSAPQTAPSFGEVDDPRRTRAEAQPKRGPAD